MFLQTDQEYCAITGMLCKLILRPERLITTSTAGYNIRRAHEKRNVDSKILFPSSVAQGYATRPSRGTLVSRDRNFSKNPRKRAR